MKFASLTQAEFAASGFTHRLDFSYSDIPTGIANNTAQVFSSSGNPTGWVPGLPGTKASDVIEKVELHVTTTFQNTADSGLNSTTVSFGDGSSATRFINAVETNKNGSNVIDTIPGATTNYIYTAAGQLQLTINSMAGKSISNLNAGAAYILLNLRRFAGVYEKAAPFGTGYS